MKERPILFSGPMVRAIIEGRKTQTRRVVKNVPDWIESFGYTHFSGPNRIAGRGNYLQYGPSEKFFPLVYGQPGDRLWVRETWSISDCGKRVSLSPEAWAGGFPIERLEYAADGPAIPSFSKRPSIHMPRWASRITLEITGVRVERLQEISEEDAEAEGADRYDPKAYFTIGEMGGKENRPDWEYRAGFADLWSSINGTDSWSSNPWVWVIEFRRVV